MDLNSLLLSFGIDPEDVVVLRHRPPEPELRKVLPWLAAERPSIFNAYQQTQGEKLEKVMQATRYVCSFIGHEPAKALFVGLYEIGNSKPISYRQYWAIPAYQEMKALGMKGFSGEKRSKILWFELKLTSTLANWKGKLIVEWPSPEIAWWRRAHKNRFNVVAIESESLLGARIPSWENIDFAWKELAVLPNSWKSALSQWRGIYYIFDISDGKGYIGSAYGEANILGRWRNYAASGHGGNRLLRKRNPDTFRFTILQRVSPDMEAADVIRLETNWKNRLHTRAPTGLNDN